MFAYAKHNLLSDEKILYEAKLHWFIYVPGLLFFIMIPFFPLQPLFYGTLILVGIAVFLRFFILKLSTEFVVTNMRVIVKTGLISRNTIELNHRNVESLSLDQGIIGRIFDFGSLNLNGTGTGTSTIPWIENPLEFRKQVLEIISKNR